MAKAGSGNIAQRFANITLTSGQALAHFVISQTEKIIERQSVENVKGLIAMKTRYDAILLSESVTIENVKTTAAAFTKQDLLEEIIQNTKITISSIVLGSILFNPVELDKKLLTFFETTANNDVVANKQLLFYLSNREILGLEQISGITDDEITNIINNAKEELKKEYTEPVFINGGGKRKPISKKSLPSKTEAKIKVNGKTYCVYKGPRGGKYIKTRGEFRRV